MNIWRFLSLANNNWFDSGGNGVPQPVVHESLNFVAGLQTVPGQPLASYANIFDVLSATTTAYEYFEGQLWDSPPSTGVRVIVLADLL